MHPERKLKNRKIFLKGEQMKVKDVLTKASQILNIESDMKVQIEATTRPTLSAQFNMLYNACMIAYEELATDYFPLLSSEEVVVQNNKIYYTDLAKDVKDIYRIEGIDGKIFRFKCFPDYCYVGGAGNVKVLYSYIPQEPEWGGDFSNFCGKVTTRSFAFLVASEYSFIAGFFDDAKIWHKRFCDSIRAKQSKKGPIFLPKRKWL